jgi:hypothetical protein
MHMSQANSAKPTGERANSHPRARAWSGHLPGTRTRLTSILERVMRGHSDFTLQERVFVTACEFWVLAMGRELHELTDPRAVARLRFAAMVYDAIGAAGVAGALHAAHGDLVHLPTRVQRQKRLKLLEERLLLSADPVDTLLARFEEQLEVDDMPLAGHLAHAYE